MQGPDKPTPSLEPKRRPDGERLWSLPFLAAGLLLALGLPLLLESGTLPVGRAPLQPLLYFVLLSLTAGLVVQTLERIFAARAYTLRRIVTSLRWDWEFVVSGVLFAFYIWTAAHPELRESASGWRPLEVLWEGLRVNMVSYFTGILVILTYITSGLAGVAHNRRIRLYAVLDLLLVFGYLFTHILLLPLLDARGVGELDPLFVALVQAVTTCAYVLTAVRFYRYLIYYITEYQAQIHKP